MKKASWLASWTGVAVLAIVFGWQWALAADAPAVKSGEKAKASPKCCQKDEAGQASCHAGEKGACHKQQEGAKCCKKDSAGTKCCKDGAGKGCCKKGESAEKCRKKDAAGAKCCAKGASKKCCKKESGKKCCKAGQKVLRHVVLFQFKEGTSQADIDRIVKGFGELPKKVETIIDFEWGTDVSVEGKSEGFTHAFVVTFRDAKGRDTYLPHPAHQEFVKLVRPHLKKVLVLDFYTQRP
ncbi:MAG: Dabb family protein [Planctomycetes bacterium]|nr:Dabb family protein [Planctomycetota bacterium]